MCFLLLQGKEGKISAPAGEADAGGEDPWELTTTINNNAMNAVKKISHTELHLLNQSQIHPYSELWTAKIGQPNW